jgi:hypothetical protein
VLVCVRHHSCEGLQVAFRAVSLQGESRNCVSFNLQVSQGDENVLPYVLGRLGNSPETEGK